MKRSASFTAVTLWAFVVVGLVILLVSPGNLGGLEIPLTLAYSAFVLGFATFGGLIASRQPANPIGWIMLVAGMAFSLGGVTGDYARQSLDHRALPGLSLAAWFSVWTWSVGATLPATFLILLFPAALVRPSGRVYRAPSITVSTVASTMHPKRSSRFPPASAMRSTWIC